MKLKALIFLTLSLTITSRTIGQTDQQYMAPPQEIMELVDIKMNPALIMSSDAKYAVLLERSTFKTLDEMAEPELGLAGIRINPETGGQSRQSRYGNLELREFITGKSIAITGLPESLNISDVSYSPKDNYIAFLQLNSNNFELWIIDIQNAKAHLVLSNVNPLFAGPYEWHPDGTKILVQVRKPIKQEEFSEKELPKGPSIQETSGTKAAVRTYQDLLKNKQDEDLFDAYMTGSWVLFKLANLGSNGVIDVFLKPAVYRSISYAPGGDYLLVDEVQKPYSYTVPMYSFSFNTNLYHHTGKYLSTFHTTPVQENLPKGFDAVYAGKRMISWRDDEKNTLFWIEAADGGDPATTAEHRDIMYETKVNEDHSLAPARELMKLKYRFAGALWGNNKTAIVYSNWWKTRMSCSYLLNPGTGKATLIQERSSQDLYTDPGRPLNVRSGPYNQWLLKISADGKKIYLTGEGYSPEGNKPFFDEMDLASFKTKRRWQADGKATYERIIRVYNPEKGEFITSIESPDNYPNYYLRTNNGKNIKQITDFTNPYDKLKGVTKETIQYKRKDGVDLSGVLYLPPGYNKESDGPLPVLMWAYPREFKDASQAGQVKESPHRFVFLNYGSPVYWAKRGYAIFDRADFPIIGEGDAEPNDNFIEQLVMNAEAAINKVAELGVGDPKRVAIGGHSYGAFMTSNLMAHSDLFAAGIARSGAYNRTLTPFGFQSEERTFWDTPELYMKMSPFVHANKINEPLLLIHGDADDNPGTFTLQSERLYGAIKGLGGTARLVLLPYESHGYSARENILHMLWETDQWLEKYVKQKK
jgi:dipeptidyl aminopeptidase/acylaminoacyl peptidase